MSAMVGTASPKMTRLCPLILVCFLLNLLAVSSTSPNQVRELFTSNTAIQVTYDTPVATAVIDYKLSFCGPVIPDHTSKS